VLSNSEALVVGSEVVITGRQGSTKDGPGGLGLLLEFIAAMKLGDVPAALEAARLHCESAKKDLLLRMAEDGAL
jgi:DNA-binding GntR family transcriptional regulator